MLADRLTPGTAHDAQGGQTPLMGAAMSDHVQAVELLLAGGAAADRVDADGLTAFGWAVRAPAGAMRFFARLPTSRVE